MAPRMRSSNQRSWTSTHAGMKHAQVHMMANACHAAFWDDAVGFNARLREFRDNVLLVPKVPSTEYQFDYRVPGSGNHSSGPCQNSERRNWNYLTPSAGYWLELLSLRSYST